MSWIDPNFPTSATPSDLVGRVLGLNPGMMTGPGTNTYLVGRRSPDPHRHGRGRGRLRAAVRALPRRARLAPARARRPDASPPRPPGRRGPPARALPGPARGQDDLEGHGPARGHHGSPRRRAASRPTASRSSPSTRPATRRIISATTCPRSGRSSSGDLILSGSTTVIPDEDGDLGQYLDSLRRVQALGVERIYSAHGPVIENAAAKIQEYIDHRLLRERQILDALGNGAATIPDMVAIIYAEVPTMLHKMAGQSVHSHLKKLRGEGRVAEDVDPRRPLPLAPRRMLIRAHLLRWRPRPGAQRTASTPRVRPSGAASQLDPSQHPAPFSAAPEEASQAHDRCRVWTCDGAAGHHADRVGERSADLARWGARGLRGDHPVRGARRVPLERSGWPMRPAAARRGDSRRGRSGIGIPGGRPTARGWHSCRSARGRRRGSST